ncbi:MAG: hypothetical protein CL772_02235 [Chloroflexi bacterium]|nr:hypothetical protein [Chloroflexota bacterium]|tara:strand:+ start:20735 stop:20986 length:252 start_codon:yes stop_codon:yes gene_type:complete
MPKKNKKNKKRTKPNVFMQSTTSIIPNDDNLDEPSPSPVIEKQNKKVSVEAIPSNYFSGEIKKMGIIATSMVVVLAVLTIVLG